MKKCLEKLGITKKLITDYTINFIAGIVGALVILFSVNKENILDNKVFLFYFVIMFILGLLLLGCINLYFGIDKK